MARPEVDALLESLLSQMSPEEALEVLSQSSEYESPPPTIDEFLDKEDYLAHIGQTIFPFWREQLRKIHPSPYWSPYKMVLLTGSTGGGAWPPL